MIRRIRIWILSFLGIFMILLFFGGVFVIFYMSAKGTSYQVEQAYLTNTTEDENAYNILSLGDSLANGTGDVSGMGFAKDYAKQLEEETKKTVNVTNLAVNGDTSDGLLSIVQKKETAQIIEQADMIFLSIGGNEVDKFVNYRSMSSKEDYDAVQKKYLSNVTTILSIIRSLNKNCKIGFLGLYNPYGSYLSDSSKIQLFDWNTKTQELLLKEDKVFYIPTYDLFMYHQDSYLTIDHFHPNIDGYQAIANRIAEILKKQDI